MKNTLDDWNFNKESAYIFLGFIILLGIIAICASHSPKIIQLILAKEYASENSCVIIARSATDSEEARRNDFDGNMFVLQCENQGLKVILCDTSIESCIETQSCGN